jgi:hypothetical protein
MKRNEGDSVLAPAALRSVLQFVALDPEGQLALFPEPKECTTCRVAAAYRDMLERYGHAPYFSELDDGRKSALAAFANTGMVAAIAFDHCHEPHLLAKGHWADLRRQAIDLLVEFGWPTGQPDPRFLCGREEFSALWHSDFERHKQARLAARRKGGTSIRFSDVPEFDPRGLTVEQFRERLSRVPWFSRLGQPHRLDKSVERINDWEEWGGPESEGCAPMGFESGRWNEALLALPKPGPTSIKALWDEVERQAMADMPFDADLDPWDGETCACLQGSHLAAFLACSLMAGASIPPNALRQWAWYARGHWPCGYSEDDELSRDEDGYVLQESLDRARLVVF